MVFEGSPLCLVFKFKRQKCSKLKKLPTIPRRIFTVQRFHTLLERIRSVQKWQDLKTGTYVYYQMKDLKANQKKFFQILHSFN